jgi:hypothetical protein
MSRRYRQHPPGLPGGHVDIIGSLGIDMEVPELSMRLCFQGQFNIWRDSVNDRCPGEWRERGIVPIACVTFHVVTTG